MKVDEGRMKNVKKDAREDKQETIYFNDDITEGMKSKSYR
jgi:hypothetical protein